LIHAVILRCGSPCSGSSTRSLIRACRSSRRSFRSAPIIYWNTIYTQHALDALPAEPDGDERAGLTPALFEHINALGAITFDTGRPAGQLRPLRTAAAA